MNFAEINFAWVTIAALTIIGFFAGVIILQKIPDRMFDRMLIKKSVITIILICAAFPFAGSAIGIGIGILISICFGWSL